MLNAGITSFYTVLNLVEDQATLLIVVDARILAVLLEVEAGELAS